MRHRKCIPSFPAEHLSRDSPPSDTPISGSLSLVENSSVLIFPEVGDSRVDFRVQSRYFTKEPTRFVLKYSHWTGRGVQGYPWIYAKFENRRLPSRVQGRPFWVNDRRCFIIDLGIEIPKGHYFDLVTQSLYVDEINNFKHFMAHRVDKASDLRTVRVGAAFQDPPATVMAGFLSFDSLNPEHLVELEPVSRYGYVSFDYQIDSATSEGFYCIYW